MRHTWFLVVVLFFNSLGTAHYQVRDITPVLTQSNSSSRFAINEQALAFLGFPIMLKNSIKIAVVDFFSIESPHGMYVQNIIEKAVPNVKVRGYDVQGLVERDCGLPQESLDSTILCLHRSILTITRLALTDGAEIINFSFAFSDGSIKEWWGPKPCNIYDWPRSLLYREMAELIEGSRRSLFVAATGNDGLVGKIGFPACLPTVFASAALEKSDFSKIATYSNRTKGTYLSPPGGMVLEDSGKERLGTSFSAPMLTALAAVYLDLLRSDQCPKGPIGDAVLIFKAARYLISEEDVEYPVPSVDDIQQGCGQQRTGGH
jgi:hypothetical protein